MWLTPAKVITVAYIFISMFIMVLYLMDFYKDNKYFYWGPPIVIFKKEVTSHGEFYALLFFAFVNKIIQTFIGEIVYTWIVNCVQDPKSKNTYYSRNISLTIVLLNATYFSINSIFVINTTLSQVSFFLVDLIANIIVIFYTNKKFIDRIFNEQNSLNIELLDRLYDGN